MQKSAIKEPIYLTKLKRRSKMMEEPPLKREPVRENNAYDLQLMYETLDPQKARQDCLHSSKPIEKSFSSHNNNRNQSAGTSSLTNRQTKYSTYRVFDALNQSDFFKCIPQSTSKQSFPNGSKLSFQYDNAKKVHNKQNTILDQPQLISLKARAVKTINGSKADILREIKLFQNNNIDQTNQKTPEIDKTRNQSPKITKIDPIKEQLQKKITNLEIQNRYLCEKVDELAKQLKEKENVQIRILKIQKDLIQLYEQNQQLQKLNKSLSKSQIQEDSNEVEVQTQCFPIFVQDSFCQTYFEEPAFRSPLIEMREDYCFEDWSSQAKAWKNELQRQRVIGFNREMEFKVIIDNIQIQNRHRLDLMQKQLEMAAVRYESKCQQIREKEGIINRCLLQKQ